MNAHVVSILYNNADRLSEVERTPLNPICITLALEMEAMGRPTI